MQDDYVLLPPCDELEKITKIELFDIIEKMEKKLTILSNIHNNFMVEFYYIDLQDVLTNVKHFQRLPFKNLTLFNIQASNKKLLSKKDFNITLDQNTIDTFVMDCDIRFQTNKLIIKKIMFPIDSEEIDLSDKIVISKLSFNTQFYNIKKVKLCRLQIKPPRNDCHEQLYTIIPVNVNDLCKHSFFTNDIEGKSYTNLSKKEITTIANYSKLFKL